MSTSKDISGHKMCPLGVKLISSIRKFHFSSSVYSTVFCSSIRKFKHFVVLVVEVVYVNYT